MKFFVGIEPEFFLMKWDGDKPVKAIDRDPIPLRRQAFGYDAEYSIDGMNFLKEIIDILNNDPTIIYKLVDSHCNLGK